MVEELVFDHQTTVQYHIKVSSWCSSDGKGTVTKYHNFTVTTVWYRVMDNGNTAVGSGLVTAGGWTAGAGGTVGAGAGIAAGIPGGQGIAAAGGLVSGVLILGGGAIAGAGAGVNSVFGSPPSWPGQVPGGNVGDLYPQTAKEVDNGYSYVFTACPAAGGGGGG